MPGSTYNMKHLGILLCKVVVVPEMVRGSHMEIGVVELMVFICRQWIYSGKLDLTSFFDANRENEIG
jgi:hypothetical protein